MKRYTVKGYINAIIAAVSYGTNPLFALPMYSHGFGVNSVLFYRYLFAVLLYGLWIKLYKKISLKITLEEFFALLVFGIIFALSSLLLFASFKYMDSGLACTILFVYPIMIALISKIFYNEHLSGVIWFALLLTVGGVALLYGGSINGQISPRGLIYVILSALTDAVYMVGIKHNKILKQIKPDKISFYVMLFGLSVFIWNLKFCTELQPINNWLVLVCALMLAIFPTIISLETITFGIKFIGATKTAIIGALEPLTALFFGVLFFHEIITLKIFLGIIMILTGVIAVILNKKH
ncbi:DMT family transporter [bacterium]|nr:DMT family transporter [bacterium]